MHKRWQIARIRKFYTETFDKVEVNMMNVLFVTSFRMTKVKYTQQTYHERLTKILDDFPKIDDIHPFYKLTSFLASVQFFCIVYNHSIGNSVAS